MTGAALEGLPGADLVEPGLADLERGVESVEALLVSIGAPRLARLGIAVPRPFGSPEKRLYEHLHAEESDAAHARYNALLRRLVSFERAAARAHHTSEELRRELQRGLRERCRGEACLARSASWWEPGAGKRRLSKRLCYTYII